MVASKYIKYPHLVDGYKYDLRIYVVVMGINEGDMYAYIANEGLVRCCTTPY